jgi:hypothetical protein
MAAFQFYFQSWKKKEKVTEEWVGKTVLLILVKNSLFKGMTYCVVVMQQPVLWSPKFGAKSSLIFTVTVKYNSIMSHNLCGIDSLA